MGDDQKKKVKSPCFGVELYSQYFDPPLYEKIQKIQDILNRSLGVPVNRIQLTEYRIGKTFFYEFLNKKLESKGFLGRCNHSGKIVYLIKDGARIEWARKEGFLENLTEEEFSKVIYSSIGVLIQVETPRDLALFLAGLLGYQTRGGYIKI